MKKLNARSILTSLTLINGFLTTLGTVEARVITNIEVKGNKRISTETIKDKLPIVEGDDIDDNDANNAIGMLYNSELFNDVKISFHGSKLVVDVKEAPIIHKIVVEGNNKIKAEDLGLKENEALSPSKIKMIQTGLLQKYQSGEIGMYNAKINPKIIKLPDNKVDLVFEISESRKAKISEIVFYGNKKLSSFELRRIISSQPKRWYRFMAKNDVYDPERVEADKSAIIRYYKNNGFAQARVDQVNAELAPDGYNVILSFKIHEGERFEFGNVSINSKVNQVKENTINRKLKCKKGGKFNATFVTLDTAKIVQDLSNQGISAINVEPHFETDTKNKKIDVSYDIKAEKRKYISKIVIRGNDKIRDYVILKELLFEEGDAYNKALITLSENNLQGTGFFGFVRIDTMPDPISPDRCIVVVSVQDNKKTGEFSLNGAYSTSDGPILSLGYGERNFLGTGKAFRLSLNSSNEQTGKSYEFKDGKLKKLSRNSKFAFLNSITAEIVDPHMFGRDIEGSLSFYKYTSSPLDTFSVKNIGGSIGISYPLTTGWSESWEVSSVRCLVNNVTRTASPAIKAQVAVIEDDRFRLDKNLKYFQNNLSHTIRYSTHVYDGLFKGNFSSSLSTTLMYNTHSKQFDLKNILAGAYIRPIGRSVSLKLRTAYGMLHSLDSKEVNVAHGFTNSMSSLRGFNENSLGCWIMSARGISKDADKNEYSSRLDMNAIGTKRFFTGSAELSFPINFASELQVNGFLFVDFGYYWKPITPDENSIFQKTKYSAKDFYTFAETRKKYTKVSKEDAKKMTLSKNMPVPSGVEYEKIIARSGSYKEELPKMLCKYEGNDDNFDETSTLIAHKIINEKKLRVSIGFGVSLVTPFGPVMMSWGFPIRKGKFDATNVFNIGMKTAF